MKKIFIIIMTTILFSTAIFAQEKINEWHIIHRYANNVNTQSLYTSNDTVIGGYTCIKIYDDNNIYKGALRNEEERTFFYNQGSSDAVILYDYSLTVGDTVPNVIISGVFIENTDFTEDINYGRYLIVDSIGMDEIDGNLRKHLYFKTVGDCIYQVIKEEWIQGIGSVHGLLFPMEIRTLAEELNEKLDLTCYIENDMLIWQNGRYTDCNGAYVDELANVTETKYLIYPNPVKDFLYIEPQTSQEKEIHLSVYNSTGHIILEKQEPVQYIDMTNYPSGVYIMQIINQEGTIEIRKIIKE